MLNGDGNGDFAAGHEKGEAEGSCGGWTATPDEWLRDAKINVIVRLSPTLLPGIKVNTSPTNYHPIKALQMLRWDGKTWVRFGPVIEGASS